MFVCLFVLESSAGRGPNCSIHLVFVRLLVVTASRGGVLCIEVVLLTYLRVPSLDVVSTYLRSIFVGEFN